MASDRQWNQPVTISWKKGKCFQCSEPRNWVSGAKGGAGCVYMDIGRKNERKMQPFPFSSPSVVGQPVNHFRFRPSKEEIKCTHFISLFHEMLGTGRVSVKSLNQCVTFTFDASFNYPIQDVPVSTTGIENV